MTSIGNRTTGPRPTSTTATEGPSSTTGTTAPTPGTTTGTTGGGDGVDRSGHGTHVATDRAGASAPTGPAFSALGLLRHKNSPVTEGSVARALGAAAQPYLDAARSFAPPAAGQHGPALQLGQDSAGAVHLSPSGQLVPTAGQDAPASRAELGETLLRAAQLADGGTNVFANSALTLPQKQAALGALRDAFASAGPASVGPQGYASKEQALQVRASAAPLMLDLAQSLDPAQPEQKALRDQAIGCYLQALKDEPHGVNRNFMIYDLHRAKNALGVREIADPLMNEVAPLTPPYDDWFKDGNKTVRVDYHVGAGFWEEELGYYERQGFSRTDNPDGSATLKKTFVDEKAGPDGQTVRTETPVEMTMHNGSSDLFKKMDDPSTHIVVYSGHANYGRHVPEQLGRGSAQQGDKVFMGLQCGGKGTHNAIAEKYPDLQQLQSKNSSYGYQDRRTVMNTLEGIAGRQAWQSIARDNRASNADNYYFPSDSLIGKRAEDRDADGKVDAFDRVVNYNSFKPEAEIARQLTPTDPGRPADQLDGKALHGSILRFHRMAGYNSWAHQLKDQKVLNDGYYEGRPGDPLVKLTQVTGEDGQPVQRLQVNKHYAHASEEVLGAALHYELGRHFAAAGGLDAKQAQQVGLLMAAEALSVDTSYNESAAFAQLVKYAGLPAQIRYADVSHAAHSDDDNPAGSPASLAALQQTLSDKHIDW